MIKRIYEGNNNIRENYEAMYKDVDGNFGGSPGEVYPFSYIKKYWKDNHEYDPILADYDSFNAWLEDTIGAGYLEEVGMDTYSEKNVSQIIKELKSWGIRFNVDDFKSFIYNAKNNLSATPEIQIKIRNHSYTLRCDIVNNCCYIENIVITDKYLTQTTLNDLKDEIFSLWTMVRKCDDLIF